MKWFVLTLTAFCFLLGINFVAFSQTTTKRKLVKCYEKGKVVYRTKCRSKKIQSVLVPKKTDKKVHYDEPYGDPNSKYQILSDGPGSGGGQGTGRGQGSGTGTGTGTGSGSGNSNEETTYIPPPTNTKATTPLKIISKPRAESTEESRKNQVQGTVTLRVTFLADGTIGTISPVRGLPDGLTAQAIEAAKKIRFEPATKDGKPITVVKLVEYSFTLY